MTRPITRRTRPATVLKRIEAIEHQLNELTQSDLSGKVFAEDAAWLFRTTLQLQRLRLRTEIRLSYRPLPRARRRAP